MGLWLNGTEVGVFTTADETKLDGIEASADVTDATNVAAAGALMDSDTDNVDNTHINWGSGTGQVDADDVPESGSRKWAGESGADVNVYASAAEVNTGSEAAKSVSPDALAGSNAGIRYVQATVVDYTTDVSTGNGKWYFHVPTALNGMNLVYCHAEVITAGTTGTMTMQIYNLTDTCNMLTATLNIDSAETGSDTAETPYTIDTDHDDLDTNDVIRLDISAVHTTPAKGLIVTLGFQLP